MFNLLVIRQILRKYFSSVYILLYLAGFITLFPLCIFLFNKLPNNDITLQSNIITISPYLKGVQEFELTKAKGSTDILDENTVNARAIYIDGDYRYTVKDTDAVIIQGYLTEMQQEKKTQGVLDTKLSSEITFVDTQISPEYITTVQTVTDLFNSKVYKYKYYEVVHKDTIRGIAEKLNMSVEDLKVCKGFYNDIQIDWCSDFKVGTFIQIPYEVDFLRVYTLYNETWLENIEYNTVQLEDPTLAVGTLEELSKGSYGEKQITASTWYDGVDIVSKEILSEKVLSNSVDAIVRTGTLVTKSYKRQGKILHDGTYIVPTAEGYISAYMGDGRGHKGIDIAAPYGTKLYAATSGLVTEVTSGWGSGYGNSIVVKNDDGLYCRYAHASQLVITKGDYITSGQLIGYMGSTGDSRGNHLHFEVKNETGVYLNPIDYFVCD